MGPLPKEKVRGQGRHRIRIDRRWLVAAAVLAAALLALGGWLIAQGQADEPREAPEAQQVLDLQAGMPFQILIPAYLPKAFDRANVKIAVDQSGPSGVPMVELTYRTRKGGALFVREWVPVNPDLEIMATSRPIQTKWGRGWLLNQAGNLLVMWVDVGPMRIAFLSPSLDVLPQEQLLAVAETMGPASNRQVFNFIVNPPQVVAAEPPAPIEIPVSTEGVQEVDLIVTPGGYSPLRFSVQKGVPVRLTFRMLGQVGCGNELNFPTGAGEYAALTLADASDTEVLEFTPQQTGQFEFFCGHLMYRGVMTVRE
jgi:Cupredoxin-like domain